MDIKKALWNLRKNLVRTSRIIRGARRATGMVALSEKNAKAVYGERDDVTILPFVRKSRSAPVPPKCLPEDASFPQLVSRFPAVYPDHEAVVLDARNGRFTFQHHHLLDDALRVIYEPALNLHNLPIQHELLVECKKIDGTIAYLANTLFCQYGHWLQRQLPMLMAYWELIGKEQIDYYYIGDGRPPAYVVESLRQLGIREDQIISEPCRGDRALICISNTEANQEPCLQPGFRMTGAAYRFLQENLFHAGAPVAGKRLFIQRGNVSGRRELNVPEIKEALLPLGFEFTTTQGMTMQHEADLFGNADVIVAVHGAALHNLLFAKPGTKVIEIFPYDYFEESNYVIANHGRCDYWYLIGEPVPGIDRGASLMERNRADVRISTDKLLRLCEAAGIF